MKTSLKPAVSSTSAQTFSQVPLDDLIFRPKVFRLKNLFTCTSWLNVNFIIRILIWHRGVEWFEREARIPLCMEDRAMEKILGGLEVLDEACEIMRSDWKDEKDVRFVRWHEYRELLQFLALSYYFIMIVWVLFDKKKRLNPKHWK